MKNKTVNFVISKIRKLISNYQTKRIRRTIKKEILSFINEEFKYRNIVIDTSVVNNIIDHLVKYNLVVKKEMKNISIQKQNKFKSELADEINKLINKMYSEKQSELDCTYDNIIKEKYMIPKTNRKKRFFVFSTIY